MRPIKVNADYEIQLFENKTGPEAINQSLEFLSLYLVENELWTTKNYNQNFISHVKSISGITPRFSKQKQFENWWGSLSNIEIEKKINSKEFVSKYSVDSQIITSIDQLNISQEAKYLAKNPYGMSGQNFLIFEKGQEELLIPFLKKSKKLVIEPFFQRVKDFSHYLLPDGKMICYENLVDNFFQYKGTVFRDLNSPDVFHLSFFKDIERKEWDEFLSELNQIVIDLKNEGALCGYSIDSFTYLERNKIRIRTISEVNYRKTMGLMTWLLTKKYASDYSWSMLVLGKSLKFQNAFEYIKNQIKSLDGCIQLSPGDTRFEMFFLYANSNQEGEEKYKLLKKLLPDCQFSI